MGNERKGIWLVRPPEFAGKGAKKGVKGKGLRYERKVVEALGGSGKFEGMMGNPWFAGGGFGLCSPDFIGVSGEMILVVEIKLTEKEEAIRKLERVYLPVVRGWIKGGLRAEDGVGEELAEGLLDLRLDVQNLPIFGLQVCKNLKRGGGLGRKLSWDLASAMEDFAKDPSPRTIQWPEFGGI